MFMIHSIKILFSFPMWQYPVKTTNIQRDITFIIPKLIEGVHLHAKWAYAPPHLTLPNNQRLPWKPGIAPSVIAEASGYPNAPTELDPKIFK